MRPATRRVRSSARAATSSSRIAAAIPLRSHPTHRRTLLPRAREPSSAAHPTPRAPGPRARAAMRLPQPPSVVVRPQTATRRARPGRRVSTRRRASTRRPAPNSAARVEAKSRPAAKPVRNNRVRNRERAVPRARGLAAIAVAQVRAVAPAALTRQGPRLGGPCRAALQEPEARTTATELARPSLRTSGAREGAASLSGGPLRSREVSGHTSPATLA
jgi:hypothetical protein